MAYVLTKYVLIAAFASLVGFALGIASFAVGLKVFEETAEIKQYN